MAASVAGPIERQFSTIAGISSMTSTSSLGQTQITIQFDLNRNIDGAALDVQTALAVAQRRLPVEMTTPPFFRKVNPGRLPGPLHQPEFADPAAVDGRRIRRDHAGAADFAASRRRPGAGLRLAEVRRARAGRSGGGRGAQHLARRHPHRVWPRPIPTRRSARSSGPSAERHAARVRRHAPGRRLQGRRRRLPQRRAGQARARSPTSSTASRTTRSRAGSTTRAPSCWRSSASPTPTPSRWSTRCEARLPQFRAQVPPSIQHGDAARPLDLDPRCGRTTCRRRWRSPSRSSSW